MLKTKDQDPYKTAGKIIIFVFSISVFIISRREEKMFWTE
jgi:hypothetical protein